MPFPIEVKALERYRIWIKYSDGAEGIVDLSECTLLTTRHPISMRSTGNIGP